MKNLVYILFLLIVTMQVLAQETTKKYRKEIKAEKDSQRMEEVKKLLSDKNFVFEARQAVPSCGKTIEITSTFEVKVSDNTVFSYLPFYGEAYKVDYGTNTSPYHFVEILTDYKITENQKGYIIKFEVKNKMDLIRYYFRIGKYGYASLNVTSIDRRPISFYGIIVQPEPEENIVQN